MNLKVEIDNGSGFCFGVTTAIRKAEEELAKGCKLYCLGDIVHNGMEVERLHDQGLETIDHEQLKSLHNAKVLLRAHGEPPETYNIARQNNIEIIDATCPVVLALQRRIKHKWSINREAQTVILEKRSRRGIRACRTNSWRSHSGRKSRRGQKENRPFQRHQPLFTDNKKS